MERLLARLGRPAASLGFAILGVLFLRSAFTNFQASGAYVTILAVAAGFGYLAAAWSVRPEAERIQTRILAAGLTLAALAHALRLVETVRSPFFVFTLFTWASIVLTSATVVAAVGAWLGAPDRRAVPRVWLIRLGMLASAVSFVVFIFANLNLGRQSTVSIVFGEFGVRTLCALAVALGYHEVDAPEAPATAEDATAPA